ncbi:MAG: enoyl-CoA hydratase-related protein [Legionellaceae bacterium]|nr:enoyl-CoA hydratase-related protein [Legionellaceae bacterium]
MSVLLHEMDAHGILTLTLNRPEKRNALSAELLEALSQAFTEAEAQANVKGILLIGAGSAFCAGADIRQLLDLTTEEGYIFACEGQRVFSLLESLSKPSIAAIHGFAFGGGCELAMAATLRIATADALFGQPEVKLGVIPGYGGTQRLARLVGKGRALDACLTGRTLSAETALAWGLVTELAPVEQLAQRAHEILRGIVALAPQAVASIMDVIHKGYDLPLDEALHLEAMHFSALCKTEDKHEGVQAFLEKRAPVFQGK